MAFDLSAVLQGQVSKLDTREVVQIGLDKIHPNPQNFYTVTVDLDLQASIALHGVLEPLLVMPEMDGSFRLISGHRRFAALRSLWDSGENRIAKAPCLVLTGNYEDYEEVQLLVESNRQRVKTAYEVSEEAARLTEAYTKAKEAGANLPGRIRDRVAQAMDENASRLGRLKVIREGLLVGTLAQAFEDDDMAESVAYKIAQMDIVTQYDLLDFRNDTYGAWDSKLLRDFATQRKKGKQTIAKPVMSSAPNRKQTLWHSMADESNWPDIGEPVLLRFVDGKNRERFLVARLESASYGETTWVNADDREIDPSDYDGWAYIPGFDLGVE